MYIVHAGNGDLEIVKYLIEKCNVYNENNWKSSVRIACTHGYLKIVKYLVETRGSTFDSDSTVVRWASERGHVDVVKYLLEKYRLKADGYDVIAASTYGHLKVVKYLLLNHEADINSDYSIAVSKAHLYDHFEIVKFLLEKCGAFLPHPPSIRYKKYIDIYKRGEERTREKAVKQLYFWWIRLCYDPKNLCGNRMMKKNYQKYKNLIF